MPDHTHTHTHTHTETLRQTALTFLSAFETLSTEIFTSVQSSGTYTHVFAPASSSPPPPLDGPHFVQHVSELHEILRGFPVRAKQIYVNPTGNQVTVWAGSETWFHDDVKDDSVPAEQWLYHGEYIFILDMDDSGTKIDRVFEFLDSKGTDQLRILIQKARANRAATTGASTSAAKPTWQ